MTAFWEQAQATAETQPKLALMREAAAVAEKAAPYIHARLSSVHATVRKVTSIKDLSDDELIALAASAGAEESEEVVGESAELVH
jgi:hypothetical protein